MGSSSVTVEGTTYHEPTLLWNMILGPSGANKTGIQNAITYTVKTVTRILLQLSKDPVALKAGVVVELDRIPGIDVSATTEALYKNLSSTPDVVLAKDEVQALTGMHGRGGGSAETDEATFLTLWNGPQALGRGLVDSARNSAANVTRMQIYTNCTRKVLVRGLGVCCDLRAPCAHSAIEPVAISPTPLASRPLTPPTPRSASG